MPFFAMSEEDVLSAGKTGRFYYRHLQGWYFPTRGILKCYQHAAGFMGKCFRGFRRKRPGKPIDWLDLGCLAALHVSVSILAPCILLSPLEGLLLYFLRIGLLGHFAFFILAPAHFPNEADLIEASIENPDFVTRQVQETINFRTGGLIG